MTDALVFECELDAPPEKVWRALTIPQYLERWLACGGGDEGGKAPLGGDGGVQRIDYTVLSAEENRSLTYRWRESGSGAIAGVEDSVVTFELRPTEAGGTWFRLTHSPRPAPLAANSNLAAPALMLAA